MVLWKSEGKIGVKEVHDCEFFSGIWKIMTGFRISFRYLFEMESEPRAFLS